jgi:DNA modification methylase
MPTPAPTSPRRNRARPADPKSQPATRVRNGKRVAIEDSAHHTPAAEVELKRGASSAAPLELTHPDNHSRARVFVGDCRDILRGLPEAQDSKFNLVFADPPFNWGRAYDKWDDQMRESDYLAFTYDWLDLCVQALRPGGALWVNIPDTWAAEIVCYLKGRGGGVKDPRENGAGKPPALMAFQNWCLWHFRFGQNATERFITSKVHALYFIKAGAPHTWNPLEVLEASDRAAIYKDPRTQSKKDGMPAGKRVPMDVWYGQFWGRVQGNSKERRHYHDNQLPEVYLERVVRACSNPGDLVLDPFLGSGTTGVIAHALARNFVGCEFSPDNAARALDRIHHGPIRLGAAKDASSAIFKKRS